MDALDLSMPRFTQRDIIRRRRVRSRAAVRDHKATALLTALAKAEGANVPSRKDVDLPRYHHKFAHERRAHREHCGCTKCAKEHEARSRKSARSQLLTGMLL